MSLKKELSRTFLESVSEQIRICDADKEYGIDLFCYKDCDDTSEDWVKQCRGVVFKGDELVMRSFPYISEYTPESLPDSYRTDMSIYKIFPSYEGTLIRMFYVKDKWFISTHRKLDAHKSKWVSAKPFGYLFNEFIESLYPEGVWKRFSNHTEQRKLLFVSFTSRFGKQSRT